MNTLTRTCEIEDRLPVDFPVLKKLNVVFNATRLNQFFKSTPQLQIFTFHLPSFYPTDTNIISTWVKLKKLFIVASIYDVSFFKALMASSNLELETFQITVYHYSLYLTDIKLKEHLPTFNNFLKSQSKTLKFFFTNHYLRLKEFETIFALEKLEGLKVPKFEDKHNYFMDHLEDFRLKEVPASNLKHLRINQMTQAFLELLAIFAKNLEKIEVTEIYVVDASNHAWFPKLIKFEAVSCMSLLIDIIKNKPEAERSRMEKLFSLTT